MKVYCKSRRGFSLVELLAVVLILGVLATVAIPLYVGQRRSAAARACKANLAAMGAAASAYALRNGVYPASLNSLVGGSEGLVAVPICALNGATYSYSPTTEGTSVHTISCPDATSHAAHTGRASTEWTLTLPLLGQDSLP